MFGDKKHSTALFILLIFLLSFIPQAQVSAAYVVGGDVTWSTDTNLIMDVVVQSGGHLTIEPGVTVTAPCSDPNTEGQDAARIEILVTTGGQLTVDGVTFQGDGTAGCWGGIYIMSGDANSSIQNSVIRDAALGIKITDSSPDIVNNEITNLKGPDGAGPGLWGQVVYGIIIETDGSSAAPLIQGNHIHHLTGGSGIAGLDGADGGTPGGSGTDGGTGGWGGDVYGILCTKGLGPGTPSPDPDIIGNTIEYLTSGACGDGGDGGDGAAGADGALPGLDGQPGGDGGLGGTAGAPGNVFGISASTNLDTYIVGNTIAHLTQTPGCLGGDGGDGGTGGNGASGATDSPVGAGGAGGQGGAGGLANEPYLIAGIYLGCPHGSPCTHDTIQGNVVHDLVGGDGGAGGLGGTGGMGGAGGKGGPYLTTAGDGGDGGDGGAGGTGGSGSAGGGPSGINVIRIELTIEGNTVYNLYAGDGGPPGIAGAGGDGGPGGEGGDDSSGTAGDGGNGGNGAAGGKSGDGGMGGYATGIRPYGSSDLELVIINNDVWEVESGQAQNGAQGSAGGSGGSGGDMGLGSGGTGGDGGDGGDGGPGGSGYHSGSAKLVAVSNVGGVVSNNTLVNPDAPYFGGSGGGGGEGGTGGLAGSGDTAGSDGADGSDGGSGMASIGGFAYGIRHTGNADSLEIYNNIVVLTQTASNSVGISEETSSQIDLMNYNNVYGWNTAYSASASPGANAISADPGFIAADDHRLRLDSPCLDTGDNSAAPAEDLNGETRPQDGDGDGTATADMGAYEVHFVNQAPTFTSTPVTSALTDQPYTYDITATDPDLPIGDEMTITADAKPDWLTLVDNADGTASLSGTPTSGEMGDHSVTLRVTDILGAHELQSFTIHAGNEAPAFTSTPVTSALTGQPYTYDITATDPDLPIGDEMTITADSKPDWLTLVDNGDGTASLSGTPTSSDAGDHSVTLRVTDKPGAYDLQTFTITVSSMLYLPMIFK